MTSILQRLVIQFLKWTEGGFNVLNMILKDLRISPLRNILTSISMLVGIIAMIGSVLVGTLGKEYLISVNAQIYGWVPTYSFSIMDCRFEDAAKMQNFLTKVQQLDDSIAVTLSMQENISFAPIPSLSSLKDKNDTLYKDLYLSMSFSQQQVTIKSIIYLCHREIGFTPLKQTIFFVW